MSQNKQPSSSGYYRGLLVGVVISLSLMTLFNQITSSVNIKPLATDGIALLKEQIQSHLFSGNQSVFDEQQLEVVPNLPPKVVRKPMNEESNIIMPVIDTPVEVVKPKVDWTPSLITVDVKLRPDDSKSLQASNVDEVVAPKSKYTPMSKDECTAKYGQRAYYTEQQKRLPPMLYTFPGSGNTWCRLLVEYSSGIFSGAVYNDESLLKPLPGEFKCNHYVSVVKVHPHTHDFEHLRTGHFASDNDKCKKGNVKAFKRAILLIRNPFDSIWSEFQRRVSKSHVVGINRTGFDWHRWQANACSLSHMYHRMWAEHHAGIEKHFSKENYLYIKYEDLKNRNGINVDTMRKVTDFLHVPASDEKLSCAFVLADNPDAHRNVTPNQMTKKEAYTKELTCRMWALFGEFASKHGYKPFNNYDCRNETHPYPRIRNVNVGAQGEYDLKWVKPGQQLIDFGGYNKTAYMLPGSQLPGTQFLKKRGPKMKPAVGGGNLNNFNKKQAKKERASQGGRIMSTEVQALKQSVKSTQSSDGIGQVGLNQPAWQ